MGVAAEVRAPCRPCQQAGHLSVGFPAHLHPWNLAAVHPHRLCMHAAHALQLTSDMISPQYIPFSHAMLIRSLASSG